MSLVLRKTNELVQKLNSVKAEFHYWQLHSECAKTYEKHHTQIRRVISQLNGLIAGIEEKIDRLDHDEDKVLDGCRELERLILEVHRIWEFFRSKFALRNLDLFADFLVTVDEFAWACYQPAQQAVKTEHLDPAQIKEPPLVYFHGASSPYAMPRNLSYISYLQESATGEPINSEKSQQVLKSMPIPVIGIPWFQSQFLPDALIIGHEVGHAMEEYLMLTQTLRALLDDQLDHLPQPNRLDHQPAWRAWLLEIFADIYGTLAAGPAFVSALIDFLAISKRTISEARRQHPNWGDYPTAYLRVMICLQVLLRLQHNQAAQDLKERWQQAYPQHAMQKFEPDIPAVIDAILAGPYPQFGNKTLTEIISFTPADQSRAEIDATELLRERDPRDNRLRVNLAAARIAFEKSPQGYQDKKVQDRMLAFVKGNRQVGLRKKKESFSEKRWTEIDESDLAAGRRLLQLLSED